jgi:hypothetical protein
MKFSFHIYALSIAFGSGGSGVGVLEVLAHALSIEHSACDQGVLHWRERTERVGDLETLYTIYYILYTIYCILYTVYYILCHLLILLLQM